jgi:hypothetical protein
LVEKLFGLRRCFLGLRWLFILDPFFTVRVWPPVVFFWANLLEKGCLTLHTGRPESSIGGKRFVAL